MGFPYVLKLPESLVISKGNSYVWVKARLREILLRM